jgi:hypothetical protein
MSYGSMKIDYRSQAEKDYQTTVYQYREMFKHIKVEQPDELRKLEALSESLENNIKAAGASNRPPGRKQRVRKKIESKQLNAQEKENERLRKELFRQKEKREASAMKERIRIQNEFEDKRVLPTRVIDHRALIPVKIDAKTTIYIKPGRDPIEARRNFMQKHSIANPEPALPTSTVGCKTDYQVWMDRVKERARKQNIAISKFHLDFFQAKFREGMKPFDCLKMYVDQMTL